MLVAYLSEERCKRKGEAGIPGRGLQWRGEWKRMPYGQGIRRAMYLLGVRRGQQGRMRLPPNWKERIGEAGIEWETMEVIVGEEMKWARAWRQFCEYDSYRSDRQRQWNTLEEVAEWPCPELRWEARANSKVMRGKKGAKEGGEEEEKEKEHGYDVMRGFRKRLRMREM
jgi:hypothetical protein